MFSSFAQELSCIVLEKCAKGSYFGRLAEKEKAKTRVKYHFSDNAGQDRWNKFVRNVESPEFVKALARHPKADDKLITHAQSLHDLTQGQTVGKVQSAGGSGKTYEIRKVPGGLGCTCPDWRFVSSVSPRHECKHIKAHLAGKIRAD